MFSDFSPLISCISGGVYVTPAFTSYSSLLIRPVLKGDGTATLYGSNDRQNFEIISDETTDFDVSKTIEILNPFYLYYSLVINSGGSGSCSFEFTDSGKRSGDNREDFIQVITESTFSGGVTLGETSSTAYRGDRGKIAFDHSQEIGNPHGTTASQVGAYSTSEADVLLGAKADLVGGFIPSSQIPAIAITEYLGAVASESAMLLLSGQKGDWCNRTDESASYVITGNDPSLVSDWVKLITPASPVSSVNGQIGVVNLSASDVGAPSGSGTSSGSNTGDETATTIKSKLGITTLSGDNTGDETATTIRSKLGITTLSGSNTGDETATTIRSKLGITTLSGDNTGDETTTTIQTKRPLKNVQGKSLEGSGGVELLRSNLNVNTQAITAATDTYLTGSNIDITNAVVGSKIIWKIVATKTAAGAASPILNLRTGVNGSLSDSSIQTITGSAQTAAADTCVIEIESTFVAVGVSGQVKTDYKLFHNLSTTGFANVPVNVVQGSSSTFNTTTANLKAGFSLNTGASAAWTIQKVTVEFKNF